MIMCVCKQLFTATYYLQLPSKSTTFNYLGTVTLHNLFTLYTFDNIGAGLWKVRIGKGGYLNVPYDKITFLFADIPILPCKAELHRMGEPTRSSFISLYNIILLGL